jgi:excisionase family DNA binding protein
VRDVVESKENEQESRGGGTPLLLRVHPDVTRMTNLGRTTIYSEIAAGRLRAVHIGRSVRIRRDDLEQWLEAQTDGSRRSAHA